MKREVFARYGLKGNFPVDWCERDEYGRVFEIDHLISREIGGADDTNNLWPQCYSGGPWNAVMKDRVENRLHKKVCKATMSLDAAQQGIVADWRVLYLHFFGEAE